MRRGLGGKDEAGGMIMWERASRRGRGGWDDYAERRGKSTRVGVRCLCGSKWNANPRRDKVFIRRRVECQPAAR